MPNGITSEQRAQIKLDMLEILQSRPRISTLELSRVLNINRATAKVYRLDIERRLGDNLRRVEEKMNQNIEAKVSIWQKISKLLSL